MPEFLATPAKLTYSSGDAGAATLLLAHGAGAAMDSPFLESFAVRMSIWGVSVVRFEFSYMAARRTGSKRRPPPKADTLRGEYLAAVQACKATGTLVIGGKSMGGRVASLVADELFSQKQIAGLVCLGYPFHPPKKPETLRTAHLTEIQCPTLIVQGEADPLGRRAEVAGYPLSRHIGLTWIAGADHDLAPKAGHGLTKAQAGVQALQEAADAVAEFIKRL